jgi:hypothetical protein
MYTSWSKSPHGKVRMELPKPLPDCIAWTKRPRSRALAWRTVWMTALAHLHRIPLSDRRLLFKQIASHLRKGYIHLNYIVEPWNVTVATLLTLLESHGRLPTTKHPMLSYVLEIDV